MNFLPVMKTSLLITLLLVVRTVGFCSLGTYLIYGAGKAKRKFNPAVPDPATIAEEKRITVINSLQLFFPVAIIVAAYEAGFTRIYTEITAYGWIYTAGSFFILALVQDAYFFGIHTFMHASPGRFIGHHVHHRFLNPTPWAAYAMSGTEFQLQNSFYVLIVFLLPLHPYVLAAYLVFSFASNVIGHSGYEIWRGTSRVVGSSEVHYLHHKLFKKNYSLYFTFWDRLFGSYVAGSSRPIGEER